MSELFGIILKLLSDKEKKALAERQEALEGSEIPLDHRLIPAGSLEYGVIFGLIGIIPGWLFLGLWVAIVGPNAYLVREQSLFSSNFWAINLGAILCSIIFAAVGKRQCKWLMMRFHIRFLSYTEFGVLCVVLFSILGSSVFVVGTYFVSYMIGN